MKQPLSPGSVGSDVIQINWKLYELDGRFYKGRPRPGRRGPLTFLHSWPN
jgi:hypothetical protein